MSQRGNKCFHVKFFTKFESLSVRKLRLKIPSLTRTENQEPRLMYGIGIWCFVGFTQGRGGDAEIAEDFIDYRLLLLFGIWDQYCLRKKQDASALRSFVRLRTSSFRTGKLSNRRCYKSQESRLKGKTLIM